MKYTRITIRFNGIAKKKRKEDFHVVELTRLPDHVTLSPEDFNSFERKAWQLLEEQGFKLGNTAQITSQFGEDLPNGMTRVFLVGNQHQIIMR